MITRTLHLIVEMQEHNASPITLAASDISGLDLTQDADNIYLPTLNDARALHSALGEFIDFATANA